MCCMHAVRPAAVGKAERDGLLQIRKPAVCPQLAKSAKRLLIASIWLAATLWHHALTAHKNADLAAGASGLASRHQCVAQ